MSDLDKFFDKKEPPVHPKVAYWKSILAKGQVERIRVTFVREKDLLVFGPARLFVHLHDAAMEDVRSPEEMAWDERINAELVKMHATALSKQNETERFGMVFNDRFRLVDSRFGDTFFNAVLVTYLKSSAFAKLDPTKTILDGMQEYRPSPGRQLEECEEMIEDVIGYAIDALHGPLKYSRPTTTDIVAGALAYYLDERFSISDRKILFPK